jgi:predicted dehydrogenase
MTSTASHFRLAILGTGNIARHHLRAITEKPEDFKLAALCDSNLDAARAFAGGASEVRLYQNHQDMLEAGGFDAVIVALPHNLHFGLAADCVRAGYPVLVEKPLVCNVTELRALEDLAKEHSVAVSAGQMRRFERDAVNARRWINGDPGRFGQLRSFDIQSWQNINAYINRVGTSHWLLDGQRAGGGVVISLAIHQLDLLRFLSGCDFEEVFAMGSFDAPFHSGAESNASVLFRMNNGAVGTLHATYCAARVPLSEAMTMFGQSGTLTQQIKAIGDYRGPFYVSTEQGKQTLEFLDQYQGFELADGTDVEDLHEFSFVNQLVAFQRAVAGTGPLMNGIADNFNTIACVDAIASSLKSGRPVAVERH